jgi:hypothetical protein
MGSIVVGDTWNFIEPQEIDYTTSKVQQLVESLEDVQKKSIWSLGRSNMHLL